MQILSSDVFALLPMLPMLLKATRISLTALIASRTLTDESAEILLAWLAFSNALKKKSGRELRFLSDCPLWIAHLFSQTMVFGSLGF